MPVFNVPMIPPLDLSSLEAPVITKVDTSSFTLDPDSNAEPEGYNPGSDYPLGGDIVNTALPGDGEASVYVLALKEDANAPQKSEVITKGLLLLPGGSYQMPLRAKLSYYLATNEGNPTVVIHAFG